MKNKNYQDFIKVAKSNYDSNADFEIVKNDKKYFITDAECDYFSDKVHDSLEYMDEELKKFERLFCKNPDNIIFWASDFNDVFYYLKNLFKTLKVKSVRLPNINYSTVFREIGIKYFLDDQKIALTEDADIQFFAADMMFSDTGSLLLSNQSYNGYEKLSNSKTNVFFVTIDKILNKTSCADIYQNILSSKFDYKCQDYILFKSSPNCRSYLFIIDNQRTKILANKDIRNSLKCVNCGRCNEVCPVLKSVGEEAYNNVFCGPISHITLPFLESFDTFQHVAYACTLCGRCEDVCPIHIPIRDMILSTRKHIYTSGNLSSDEKVLFSKLRKYLFNRNKLNKSTFIKKHFLSKYLSNGFKNGRKVPSFSKIPFNKIFFGR